MNKKPLRNIGFAISYLIGFAIVTGTIHSLITETATTKDKLIAFFSVGLIMTGFFIGLGKVRKK